MSGARRLGGAALSPYSPDYRACPHRVLDRLRGPGPLHDDPEFDRVLLTALAPARAMLLRPDVSAAPRTLRQRPPDAEPGPFEATILQQDPPEHRGLRIVIARALAPAAIAGLATPIAEDAAALLDAVETEACFDARARFAMPLAARTTARLMDLDGALTERLPELVEALTTAFDPLAPAAAVEKQRAVHAELMDTFRLRSADCHAPGVVGQLARAGRELKLPRDEVAANCVLLLGGGIATTADLITNGLRLLLSNPAQLARLRADPGLIAAAVEESLRLEPPAAQYARVAARALSLDGVDVAQGVGIGVSAIATGRDPAVHERPDEFDLGRGDHTHLAFAAGIHACPGAHLSRMEAAIGWRAMLDRFPGLRLAEPMAERRVSLVFNGWETLRVHPR